MSQITNDFTLGVITITHSYNTLSGASASDATPYFYEPEDEYIISFIQLEKVESFETFNYVASGVLESCYLETQYRVSRNGNNWTTWFELNSEIKNFPPFDPLDQMYIDIKFIRKGTKLDGEIRLISFELNGKLLQDTSNENIVIQSGKQGIIKSPFI